MRIGVQFEFISIDTAFDIWEAVPMHSILNVRPPRQIECLGTAWPVNFLSIAQDGD
jgi:hypothetical protein